MDGAASGLAAWLLPRLDRAESVAIRTGFVSVSAIKECLAALAAVLDRQGELMIVLGGEGEQADPAALQELLQLTAGHEYADVRVVTGSARFHNAKTYYVRYPSGHAEAWVGSANLTQAGLHSNDEAALTLDSTVDDSDTLDKIRGGVLAYRADAAAQVLSSDVIRMISELRATAGARRDSRAAALSPTTRWEDLLQPSIDELDATADRESDTIPAQGVPTGFTDLDTVMEGLRPGTLTVIASRPGVGRSTLLLDFVRTCAIKHRTGAALFNMELPNMEIAHRILSAEARIRLQDMRSGRMSDDDWTRLAQRTADTSDAPMWINTTPAASVDALCAEASQLQAQRQLALIAVDPLSSVTAPVEPGASRERELSTAVRRLKTLALQLHVPVVVTAELKRGPDARYVHTPALNDLRESDTVQQVADNIILINRPDAWERDDPRAGEAELILAKHRSGPVCTVTVAHQLHYSRFADLAQD